MELLLLIAGAAGILWGAIFVRHCSLLGLMLLTLLVGCCFGHAFIHFDLGPLPLTLDRLLLGMLAIAYGYLRFHGQLHFKPLQKVDVIFGFLLLIMTINTLMHDYTYAKWSPGTQLAFLWITPAITYFVARDIPVSERQLRAVMWSLALFSLYLAATALAETQELWAVVFPKYIRPGENNDFLGRGRGPFLNPVANGLYMSVGLAALLFLWSHYRQIGIRCLVLMGLGVMLLGFYCTYTRSIWLSAALVMAVVIGTAMPRHLRVPVISAGAICLTLFIAVNLERLTAFKRDKGNSAAETKDSVELRPLFLAISWNMFIDKPLLGHGLGHYRESARHYFGDRTIEGRPERIRGYIQHNVFLDFLTELGLVGFIPFVTILAMWLWNGWQLWCAQERSLVERQLGILMVCLLATYSLNGVFHEVSTIPMVNALLFLFAGLTTGVFVQSKSATPNTRRSATDAESRTAVAVVHGGQA